MKMKGLIIHLDRASARQSQVEKIKSVVPFETEVVSACDAQSADDQLNSVHGRYRPYFLRPRYPRPLTQAEIACFQSHRKCWKKILDENLDVALIVEDDVELDGHTFPKALDLAMGVVHRGDFVRFPYKNRELQGREIIDSDGIVVRVPLEIALGTQAQIVTTEAARRLLEQTAEFDRPVDCYLQMQWEHNVRVLSVWPSGVTEISEDLGGSMIRHKVSGVSKIRKEVDRYLYRRKIKEIAKASFLK